MSIITKNSANIIKAKAIKMFSLLGKKKKGILMGLKTFLYENCSLTSICLSIVTVLLTIVSFSSSSHSSRNKDYLFGQWCLEPLSAFPAR